MVFVFRSYGEGFRVKRESLGIGCDKEGWVVFVFCNFIGSFS